MKPDGVALLIIDMLNEFLSEGGVMPFPRGRAIVPTLQKVISMCREQGIPVIYVNESHRPGYDDVEFNKRGVHCIAGSWGAQVIDELAPEPGDHIVAKRRYSGFYDTDMDTLLRELGVQKLVVTGCVTNICVRSTVHDAFFRGYEVIVPRDCVEATGQREQDSSLFDIETHFGEVTDAAGVIARFKSATPAARE
ncbi:MAG: cysteine hydrolase family protein [Nitrospinota bacterium]